MSDIMVRRWSFCGACGGDGCPACRGSGKVVELVPLDSIPLLARREYSKAQADFIEEQRVKRGGK